MKQLERGTKTRVLSKTVPEHLSRQYTYDQVDHLKVVRLKLRFFILLSFCPILLGSEPVFSLTILLSSPLTREGTLKSLRSQAELRSVWYMVVPAAVCISKIHRYPRVSRAFMQLGNNRIFLQEYFYQFVHQRCVAL